MHSIGRGSRRSAANTPTPNFGRQFIRGPVRGVVTGVYVYDTPADNRMANTQRQGFNSVYVDVIVYGQAFQGLVNRALVTVPNSGLHEGLIWRPKATEHDLDTQGPVDRDLGSDPQSMDGHHCLVDFIEGDPLQPVVVGWIPHPRSDQGNESDDLGPRLRLLDADGRPLLWKHRGVFFGVTTEGDFVIDLSEATSSEPAADGAQPAFEPGRGNVRIDLPSGANVTINGAGNNTVTVNAATVALNAGAVTHGTGAQQGVAREGDATTAEAAWEAWFAAVGAATTNAPGPPPSGPLSRISEASSVTSTE